MMAESRRCSVCGRDGADILCSKCGRFICEDCYNEEEDACIRCSPAAKGATPARRVRVLPMGLAMMLLGLSIAASALVAWAAGGEGMTIIFPFITGNVSGWVAGLYSLIFFAVVISASMLPWYLHTRAEASRDIGDDLITLQESKMLGGEGYESVEYMITTELPKRLQKSMTIEADEETIYLRSSAEAGFNRSYPIPEGFDLEGIDYDYEEGYLVLKLHLVKVG
jgi:hypothetical protein